MERLVASMRSGEEPEAVNSAKWRGMSTVSRGSTNAGVMLNRLVLPVLGAVVQMW